MKVALIILLLACYPTILKAQKTAPSETIISTVPAKKAPVAIYGVIRGEITEVKISSPTSTITIKSTKQTLSLSVTDKTKIRKGKNKIRISDIRTPNKAVVRYRKPDKTATSITLIVPIEEIPKEEPKAAEPTPQPTEEKKEIENP